MEPWRTITAVAVPLAEANVDTGRIFPSRFLRKPRAAGYAQFLFRDARYDEAGNERPECTLNRPAYRGARILVAGADFGCGSSREAAVHALVDTGFRCVIAPSFGDTFYSNCFPNGLLPVVLPAGAALDLQRQLHEHPGAQLSVDLERQSVQGPDGTACGFHIDAARKLRLTRGLDDAALALENLPDIERFERRYLADWSWAAPQ